MFGERIYFAAINIETETNVTLEAHLTGLPIKALWDVVVLAYGCRDDAIASGLELSKQLYHDIVLYIPIIIL